MSVKVLVICDSPDDGAFIEHILVKDRGDEVESVDYSHQALAEAERNPPDIIILEVILPELDVFDVYQQLRSRAALRMIPVLFWRTPNTRYVYPKAQTLGVAGCLEFMDSYQRNKLLQARDAIAEGMTHYPPLD